MSAFESLRQAWAGIMQDQRLLRALNPGSFTARHPLRALLQNPSLQFTFGLRLARGGGLAGWVARALLIHNFGSDATPGAPIHGGIYAPHPVGIVIGGGAEFDGDVSIYQHVTIGASRTGAYPRVGNGATVFAGSVVFGGITLGAGCTVGAGLVVCESVPSGTTVRGARSQHRAVGE